MSFTDEILRIIGEIVAYGGGAAIIAYFIFQFLGRSWIENQFARSLERHRHEQAIELQRLRVEIDSILSGRLKIQEKEYEILPLLWDKLYEARSHVLSLLLPFHEYPDLDRMNNEQLNEFLEICELKKWQKNAILEAGNKVDKYKEFIFFLRLHETRKACHAFHICVSKNAIFCPKNLKDMFISASDLLWSSTTSKQIGTEAGDFKIAHEGWKKILSEFEPLFKEIEAKIHERFQEHSKVLR